MTASDAGKNFGALLEAVEAGSLATLKEDRPRPVVLSARLCDDFPKAFEGVSDARFARPFLRPHGAPLYLAR